VDYAPAAWADGFALGVTVSEANAIHSLYGGGAARRALSGNVGGQSRVQEVLSPDFAVDAAREALGGEIGVDPCASSNPANWFARNNFTLSEDALALEVALAALQALPKPERIVRKREIRDLKRAVKAHYLSGAMVGSWGGYELGAYLNPAYGYLKQWTARVQLEHRAFRRMVCLWPFRPHRVWWVRNHAGCELIALNYNVVFKGHKSAFPAPLCMVAFNCRIPNLGKRENWRVRL
jgi:hypothetical protein